MSKSNPTGAIVLDDDISISLSKVKKAQTAFAGEMTDSLDSLLKIGKFVSNTEEINHIDAIMIKHMNGENVMGELKGVINVALERYLREFQAQKSKISDLEIEEVIKKGGEVAKRNAKETIQEVRKAMELKYIS